MENDKDFKNIWDEILSYFSQFNTHSILAKCIKMDFQLLNLTSEEGLKFSKDNQIFPGYNSFLNVVAFLEPFNISGRNCTYEDVGFLSKKLDDFLIKDIPLKGAESVNAMSRLQLDWQKKYIFKTFLLYLIISNSDVNKIYKKSFSFSPIELSAICLFNKFMSTEKISIELLKYGVTPSNAILNYADFIYNNFPFISISIEDFRKKQIANFIENDFDLFSSRLLIRDYPIISFGENHFLSSYFYIQNSLYGRLIHYLSEKGVNSKVIGNAYEQVVFDLVSNNYSHIEKDSLGDSCIQLNPRIRKTELCDILVKKGDKYLLIDCKSKEFIESIYNDKSEEKDAYKEKLIQRLKRIEDIKNNRFLKYFPINVDVNKIYSLVAIIDDCGYSKSLCIDSLKTELSDEEIDYCNKHIDFLNYDDLLEFVVSDVDIIACMERNITNGNYVNPLITSIKQNDKGKYCADFDIWYKNAANTLVEIIKKYNLVNFKS